MVGGALLLRGGDSGPKSESRWPVGVCTIGRLVTLLAIEFVFILSAFKLPIRVLELIAGPEMNDPAREVGRDCGIPA
jgi:hypothetical protein